MSQALPLAKILGMMPSGQVIMPSLFVRFQVRPMESFNTRAYSFVWMEHLAEVPQASWDALALPLQTPFFEWEWLYQLEASGSVQAETGWMPRHLTVWRDSQLVAAAPLYLKGHSYGEFVFDHQWAELSQQLGLEYYPKLVGMIPLTPVPGYRFLMAPTEDEAALTEAMLRVIDDFCRRAHLSGCHFLYIDPTWQTWLKKQGFHLWWHHHYIWNNQNYQNFEDYLDVFSSHQRKNIKRERRLVQQAGIKLDVMTGQEITPELLAQMYEFYSGTCDKFGWWGSKYLTAQFFTQIAERYRHRLAFVVAQVPELQEAPVGMSFCVYKGDQLYGRYWGSTEYFANLHFEVCYYRPIEWAIHQGIQRFDPGAGGEHKKRRGFAASPHYSFHKLYQPRLAQIIYRHLAKVNLFEQEQITSINEELPFEHHPPGFPEKEAD